MESRSVSPKGRGERHTQNTKVGSQKEIDQNLERLEEIVEILKRKIAILDVVSVKNAKRMNFLEDELLKNDNVSQAAKEHIKKQEHLLWVGPSRTDPH